MTTAGLPEAGPRMRAVRPVDQVHPARGIMPEEVFDKPLMEPLYAFPDGRLPMHRFFSCEREEFPCNFYGSVPPDREKEAGNEGPRGLFHEQMC